MGTFDINGILSAIFEHYHFWKFYSRMQYSESKPNYSLHEKWSFRRRISPVNVTKLVGNSGFGHIYWRNPSWKTLFFLSESWNNCHTKKFKKLVSLIFVLVRYDNPLSANPTNVFDHCLALALKGVMYSEAHLGSCLT